jgi:hypothetical protein
LWYNKSIVLGVVFEKTKNSNIRRCVNMKIKSISVIFILILAVMLTACGGKTNTPAPTVTTSRTEDNGNSDNNNGVFDPNNIGINNGNDNNNSGTFDPNNIGVGNNDSDNSNNNNVDMTGHEPHGSGNFQDYWQGESYFDLEGYLYSQGAERVTYDASKNDKTVRNGFFGEYSNNWAVYVPTIGSPSNINGMTCVATIRYQKDDVYVTYGILYKDGDTTPITVDSYGNKCTLGTLQMLEELTERTRNATNDRFANILDGCQWEVTGGN